MLNRREFLESIVGVAAVTLLPDFSYATPSPSDSNFILTQQEFEEFLTRPVRETLRDTRVRFVTVEEYDIAVNQTSLPPDERKGVVSLVYDDALWSRGLSALVYTFDRRYSDLKTVAVSYTSVAHPSQDEIDSMGNRFQLRSFPALVFYNNVRGIVTRANQMQGGICEFSGRGSYNSNIDILCPFIETEVLTLR